MGELNREQLEKMVDVLSNLVLEFVDAQTAERLLKANGFESEELRAIGFDVDIGLAATVRKLNRSLWTVCAIRMGCFYF